MERGLNKPLFVTITNAHSTYTLVRRYRVPPLVLATLEPLFERVESILRSEQQAKVDGTRDRGAEGQRGKGETMMRYWVMNQTRSGWLKKRVRMMMTEERNRKDSDAPTMTMITEKDE